MDTRQVKLKLTVLRICNIDLEKYSFEADLMIQATWREPSLNDAVPEVLARMKLSDYWNLNLKVSNALLFYLMKTSSALFFKSRKQAMARLLMRVRALFPIHFSAATFPFEELTLPIFITTERLLSEVMLVRDGSSNLIAPEVLEDSRKWMLQNTVNVLIFHTDIIPHLGMNNLSLDYIGARHPVFSYQCKIRRKTTFFFLSSFIWQTLMTYVAFSSFCINSRLLHFRLLHSLFVLFLTTSIRSLTFASFFNRSAITYEEMYFLMTWMMQFCLLLWHVFSAIALSLSVYMERIDHAAHLALELLYLTEVSMFYYLVKGQSVSWMDMLSSTKLPTGVVERNSRKLKAV